MQRRGTALCVHDPGVHDPAAFDLPPWVKAPPQRIRDARPRAGERLRALNLFRWLPLHLTHPPRASTSASGWTDRRINVTTELTERLRALHGCS